MGVLSAKAQGLRAPITSIERLLTSDHRLYILKSLPTQEDGALGKIDSKSKVLGILKVGRKHLFLSDVVGRMIDANPVCALDFYVHESCQRTGCGRLLFECMMKNEGLQPWELALDRPSHKFLSFLRKHYNLVHALKQANNYVVFRQFFSPPSEAQLTGRGRAKGVEYQLLGGRRLQTPTKRSFLPKEENTTGQLTLNDRPAMSIPSKNDVGAENSTSKDLPGIAKQSLVPPLHLERLDLNVVKDDSAQPSKAKNKLTSGDRSRERKQPDGDDDVLSVEVHSNRRVLSQKGKPSLPLLQLQAGTGTPKITTNARPPPDNEQSRQYLLDHSNIMISGSLPFAQGNSCSSSRKVNPPMQPLRIGRQGLLPLPSQSGLMAIPANSKPASESEWADQLQQARKRSLDRLGPSGQIGRRPRGTGRNAPTNDWKRTSWNVFGIPYTQRQL